MARKRDNEIEIADDRVKVLKKIIGEERRRAEANPSDERNIGLGIVELDSSLDEARKRISSLFGGLEDLLEHLHILYMAASFEMAAKRRLGTVIGESRSAIRKARKDGSHWPERLVKSSDSFKGLDDIAEALALSQGDQEAFGLVRHARNAFSHGTELSNRPKIGPDEALEILLSTLDALK